MAAQRKVRYAVVGLGHIAQVAVLPAFAHARKNSELVALVSGDKVKQKKLAAKYGVKHVFDYSGYEECLKSGLVDAVYIALPNHLHREYTEKAARYGIHVLCEKPLAVTSRDAKAMMTACEKGGVKLMTAYRLHFQSANLEAGKIADSGRLGELRFFNSTFSFSVREGNIRLDEERGGGPLLDIGVYCINAARSLFREAPSEVTALGSAGLDKRFDTVDEMVSANMRFSNGRLASFTCSFAASPTSRYELVGTKGRLVLENSYSYAGEMELTVETGKGKPKKRVFKKSDQFAAELTYFSDCILNDRTPEPGGKEGLIDVQIVEALLTSQQKGRAVKIDINDKAQKPHAGQKIRKPPVKLPRVINAESPTR